MDYPALSREHLRDARLFATRDDMVAELGPKGGVIAEIGVAIGGFSRVMLDALRPEKFVAFDLFELHNLESLWGHPTAEVFRGKLHRAYYESRFPTAIIEEGLSHTTLDRYPDKFFDMIYIDAAHDYEGVKRDAEISAHKLRSDGLLVFNDYIMADHLNGTPYGVVPVVNEMVVNDGWRVVGFALQRHMFCDIAIRRDHVATSTP
jgi:hypothetical protein